MKSNHTILQFLIISSFAFAGLIYAPLFQSVSSPIMEERCDNSIDDDSDGLIDLNDPDCTCEILEPESLIPNPSFEAQNCCPDNRSQLDCAEVWIQASAPTTDYLHTCGWMGWEEFPPPRPFPDGNGIMGFRDGRVRRNSNEAEKNWKEYAGACLLKPLKAGTTYRFEFHVGFVNSLVSPAINISFFGTPACTNLPFGVSNEDFGCPTNGSNWFNLGAVNVAGGSSRWVKTNIEVTPTMDIAAIAIGPDCPGTSASVSTYYFFDNLVLADLRSFEFQIEEEAHPCSNDFSLSIPFDPNLTYQWYKEGIALPGETFPELSRIYGEGNYQVRMLEGASCKLSKIYNYTIPIFNESVNKTICKDGVYSFAGQTLNASGQYIDTLKNANNCDSIVTLNLKELGTLADTVNAKIFEGQSYELSNYRFSDEGNHLLNLKSTLGCDSLVLLQLEHYPVFIPNVFSPNEDNINDFFSISSNDELLESAQLRIFDRWGSLLYEGEQWDGKHNGSQVRTGVYVYIARLKSIDGTEWNISGSVTVLR